ncbi:MAG: serine--tRNA ligase [Planctomycetota bacterium]|nr:serine--tRNA ligase [Planctomycetota bacterium]
MIDLKLLRENPDHFIQGAAAKGVEVDIPRLLELDQQRRELMQQQETLRSEQKKLGKETGPQIGKLKGQLKAADESNVATLEAQITELEARPAALKGQIQELDESLAAIEPEWKTIQLKIPQPPDDDVPRGASAEDNIEIRRWAPEDWDWNKSFQENRGFAPKTHMELVHDLGLVDFERGVKVAGSRSYVLTGDGMRLHQAILAMGMHHITESHGFRATSVPVLVREQAMVGTGFFPGGIEQTYHIDADSTPGPGQDLYLTGTGEVGLMSLHADEIVDADQLPMKYATVSTCFRREAGAAGKDTAGLYRIHQFDKVEQVIIDKADEEVSRDHHQAMIGIVEALLQSLQLPYRLLQCCTGDLGTKNADMIDIDCWIPGRGEEDAQGRPSGEFGETHSASRLYDFQCRRLNLRYRDENGKTVFCHSLNNTVVASPRILIPILEMHQQADGSVVIPEPLRPFMYGSERIQK